MSSSSSIGSPVAAAATSTARAIPWRAALLIALVVATVGGFAVGSADANALAVQQAGVELTRLLHFMAAIKALMSIALAAAVAWRLAQPISGTLAVTYIVATMATFAAPGLVWQMAHVAAGAVLFHGGWLLLLTLAMVDGEGRATVRQRFAPASRRVQR